MGDNNAELFREKFELLKDTSPLSSFCDTNLIRAENKHIFDSSKLEDHHALIPLGALPEEANEAERNVYAIVLESFFTVCMPDFLFTAETLRFHIGEYCFTASICEVIQKGFQEAKQHEEDTVENEEEVPKPFDQTDCVLKGLSTKEKTTEPKKEYSIDTLLAFMEHPKGNPKDGENVKLAGLGTPTTRAEIIKTLFSRGYVSEEKKKLGTTSRGLFLLEQLSKHEELSKMTGAAHTTEWEQKLNDDPEQFEREIAEYVKRSVADASTRSVFQSESLGSCPLCGKSVRESKPGYGCSGYRDEPKCPFMIWKTVAGAAVTENDAKLLLLGQKTHKKKCKKKDDTPFEAAFALEGGKVVFLFQ